MPDARRTMRPAPVSSSVALSRSTTSQIARAPGSSSRRARTFTEALGEPRDEARGLRERLAGAVERARAAALPVTSPSPVVWKPSDDHVAGLLAAELGAARAHLLEHVAVADVR